MLKMRIDAVDIMYRSLLIALVPVLFFGCDTHDMNEPVTFVVQVENISTDGTIGSKRANGTVPLSPGAFAVFRGSDPMFTPGQAADLGTERIAEDGFPETKAAMLEAAPNVSACGTFDADGGFDDSPAIFPGESSTFTVTAVPGDRLQLQTMFVQSNDWFYAFDRGGIELFNKHVPVGGDATFRLVVYDAGTEEDTPPGSGDFQKMVQDPQATDFGPRDDDATIRPAQESGFTLPADSSVIRITISRQ